MHSPLRYVVVDVFTDTPLAGNQLAVFTNASGLPTEVMQALAREMAFSETVFVTRAEQGGHARMRIFTPTQELPFAGHPTLGTAVVLAQPMQVEEVRLETLAGLVPVRVEREGPKVVFGRMQQPLPTIEPCSAPEALLTALGLGGAALPIELYKLGPCHALVAAESHDAVAQLRPDLQALARFDHGVSVFAGAGDRYKARVFVPSHGVPEDAATGSAAGPLAVHLARHGRIAFGDEITIEQGAELGRPSLLYACAHGRAGHLERVEVGGAAVVVAHGEFRLPPGIAATLRRQH